jgi:hypothetical protein
VKYTSVSIPVSSEIRQLRWPLTLTGIFEFGRILYSAPELDQAPQIWMRGLLLLTFAGVSFAHGSNDGQKGMQG